MLANCSFTIFGNDSNPIWWTANLSTHVCNWYCGAPTIDPNVGFITQPLGHLAATDLIHGHLPWWNYDEGLGQPLAGEMQSAALFPLVLLFLLPAGLLIFHLTLQVIAGISCYLLVRRLGIGFSLASLSGVLFALNGTFAWVANAVINPLCFLPLLILGIELTLESSRATRRAGIAVTALAVALSLYAGFPEMAYLDALLAFGWAVTRVLSLERSRRRVNLAGLGAGGGLGLALALPILVAFYDFAKVADLGDHANHHLAATATAVRNLPLLVNPYAGGALLGGSTAVPYNVLGYFTASVAVFAIVGVGGRRLRPLRLFLGGWLVVALAGAVNLLEVRRVWNLLPGMDAVAFARYVWPTAEFAVIVLAALGLSDIVERGAPRKVAQWATLAVGVIVLASILLVTPFDAYARTSLRLVLVTLIVVPFFALVVLGFALRFLPGRAFAVTVMAIMAFESVMFFTVPTFRTPASINVVSGTLSYLQRHEGLDRFLSLGVLTPNWGSQYSLHELNVIDLPEPAKFSGFVHTDLAPSSLNPRIFIEPFTARVEDEVASHLANFEAVGVAYILTPAAALDPALGAVGLTLVASDSLSRLYRVGQHTTFYSTSSTSCTLANATTDRVTVTCPSPTSLTRLELSMPGWSADVNGRRVPLTSANGLTQTVAVPAGSSTVSFEYLPPHEEQAALIAVAALVALMALVVAHAATGEDGLRRRWRRRVTTSRQPGRTRRSAAS